jgi:hypothetical protein
MPHIRSIIVNRQGARRLHDDRVNQSAGESIEFYGAGKETKELAPATFAAIGKIFREQYDPVKFR